MATVTQRSKVLPALIVCAFAVCPAASAQEAVRIAAVVNDEVISLYDLSARLTLAIASSRFADSPEARRRLAPQVLRSLIDEKVKLQEAKRLKIQVTRAEIDGALSQIETQNKLPPGGLDDFLAAQGVVRAVLIDQIEAGIAWSKVINSTLRARVAIGEDEVDEVLARMKANEGKPEQRIAEIFLPVDNPDREDDVRLTAERIVQRIKAGADYAALARGFSQSASAAVGGDLGWTRLGQLGGNLDAAVARLRPGEVSPPIRTPAGYHILLLKARRAAPRLGEAEITLTLQQLVFDLPPNAAPEVVAGRLELARSKGGSASNCADMESLGKALNSPLSGSLGTLKLGQLPEEFRSVLRDLPVGKASPPLRRGDAIVVLMVCSRDAPRSELDERARIRSILLQRRLDAAARRHLRDLRRAAFVDVRI